MFIIYLFIFYTYINSCNFSFKACIVLYSLYTHYLQMDQTSWTDSTRVEPGMLRLAGVEWDYPVNVYFPFAGYPVPTLYIYYSQCHIRHKIGLHGKIF